VNRESQSESRRDGATFSRTEKMTYATAKSRTDESSRNLASGEVRERSTSGFPHERSIHHRRPLGRVSNTHSSHRGRRRVKFADHAALNLAVNNIAAQAWPFCSHPGLFEGAGKETVPKPGRVYV